MEQETLVLIKSDGVKKNIIGAVIDRFERVSLKVIGLRMINASEELANTHYILTQEWGSNVARKTRESFAKKGIQMAETDEQIASRVHSWLKKMLMAGPIVAIALRGDNAIEIVRKLIGATEPRSAASGTIRGDYSTDSYADADREKRALWNVVHASESTEEAKRELEVWFGKGPY